MSCLSTLEVRGLEWRLPGLTLGPISFHLRGPGCWWVLGPSGAGKSMLFECLSGFHAQSSGLVKVLGREVSHLAPEQRSIAMMPQRWQLFPHWTARQNLRYAAALAGQPPERVQEVAESLEVAPLLDRSPREISGGETQRFALAQTLLSPAKVLLLDEPLSAIDAPQRINVLNLVIREAADKGRTFLIASHRPIEGAPLQGFLRVDNCQLSEQSGAA